ncbi:MAG: hypothetical protein KKB70_08970 [Proteobacteria bacterium]|nr:hypothetical protein [Pseudomonadota bacterium]MBU1610703.1 hypothetical protein [Pseudomonadota bacterium]
MKNRQTFTLIGTMKNISPLTFTDPNPNVSAPAGENIVRLPRMQLITREKNGSHENASPVVRVPFLSSNSLRGRLRRECAYAIFDRFLAEGVPVPLAVAHWMRAGAGRNVKDMVPSWLTPMQLEQEIMEDGNLHTGLWGAGLRCPSRVMISDVIPHCVETVQQGLFESVAPIDDLPQCRDLTGFRGWVRKNDCADSNAPQNYFDAAEIDDLFAAMKNDQAAKKKKAKDKAEGTESTEPSEDSLGLQQIGCVEYLAPGTVFNVRIRFADVAPIQVGMFMAGLARFADNPVIGGNKRWGFGRVNFVIDDEQGRSVTVNDAGFASSGFEQEIDVFDEWRDSVSLERLHTLGWLEDHAPTPKKQVD